MNKSLLYFYNILFIILINIIKSNGQNNIGAEYRACSLLKTTIYCFAGHRPGNGGAVTDFNDHYSLDLSQYNNFTTFSSSNVTWESKSNLLTDNQILEKRSYTASVPIYSENSYLVYGGVGGDVETNSSVLIDPFIAYQSSSNQWKSLSLLSVNNYTNGASMVNLGNDTIFIWGGRFQSLNTMAANIIYFYDYRNSVWKTATQSDWIMVREHTATLGSDNMIYVMGGTYLAYHTNDLVYPPFTNIKRYDTQTLSWTNISSNGDEPFPRSFHTTIQIPNSNLLFIYGGINIQKSLNDMATSLSYTYDITSNTFKKVNVPKFPNGNATTRFGHFATAYTDKYLVFAFGYTGYQTPSNTLDVLNITNMNNVSWVGVNVITPNEPISNNSDGDSNMMKNIIPAIVVPIVMVVLGGIIAILLYKRYKKKKSSNQNKFVVDDDDDYVTPKYYTKPDESNNDDKYNKLASNEELIHHKNSSQFTKSYTNNDNMVKPNLAEDLVKPDYGNDLIKPDYGNDLIKPDYGDGLVAPDHESNLIKSGHSN